MFKYKCQTFKDELAYDFLKSNSFSGTSEDYIIDIVNTLIENLNAFDSFEQFVGNVDILPNKLYAYFIQHELGIPIDEFIENGGQITQGLFSGSSIYEAELPKSGTIYLDQFAFKGCGELNSITLPESVVQVGRSCFASSGIKEITCLDYFIPEDYCFAHNSNLRKIVFSGPVEALREGEFYGDIALDDIYFYDNQIEKIGYKVFTARSKHLTVHSNKSSFKKLKEYCEFNSVRYIEDL